VAYFITVCFKEILVSPAWRWRHSNVELCRNYVKDSVHKLKNTAFVRVAWVSPSIC